MNDECDNNNRILYFSETVQHHFSDRYKTETYKPADIVFRIAPMVAACLKSSYINYLCKFLSTVSS